MSHLPHSSSLGTLKSANFNTTSDQVIPINSTKYVVRKVVATNPSTSLTTAVGGIYNATSKPAGGIVVPAAQVWSLLTSSGKFLDVSLNTLVTTDVQTATGLYLSLTIAQGVAASGDIYIFGDILES